jgi:HAD superfamily hydrolase (TIGR01509 family)
MSSLDAILFDLGGTLDGRGAWRHRFHRLLREAGIDCSPEERAAAFAFAEMQTHATGEMASASLRGLVTRHAGWQLEALGIDDDSAVRAITDRFVADVAAATAANRTVLEELAGRGLKLAVVSNACGNAARLCEEFGYAPLLTAVVDSQVFGAAKPDVKIFRHALTLVGTRAERSAFVGDRLDRDIEPAKSIGMRTVWIAGDQVPATAAAADVVLDNVAQLPAALVRLSVSQESRAGDLRPA